MFDEHHDDSEQFAENIRKYADWKLQVRLLFYFLIAAAILSIGIYHIAFGQTPIVYPTIGLIIGMIIGIVVSRVYKLTWDHRAQTVVARLDALGIIILAAYIVLELNREKLVEYFVHDSSAIAISFAVLAGIMVGRIIGIRRKVNNVLDEHL